MKGRKKTCLEPQMNSNTRIGDQSVYGKDVRTTKYTKNTKISVADNERQKKDTLGTTDKL